MPPQKPEQDASALEELRRSLYANAAPSVPVQVTSTHLEEAPVEEVEWKAPEPPAPKKKLPLSILFLMGAALIFALALAVAAYFLVFGGRAISIDHVEITVEPTPSLKSGEVAQLLVTIKNGNPTAITNTRLSAAFPDSARSAGNPREPYPRFEDTVGTIPAGEERTQTIQVALSGAEGQTYEIPLKLEYRTEGSNAVFVKDATHDVTISSSPLSVRVQVPSESAAGQQLSIQVTVRSDAPAPIEGIAVVPDAYPAGFVPTASSTIFDIGTLAPGESKSITITGTMVGEATDERVFKFKAGTRGAGNTLALVYASGQGSTALAKPFLSTTLSIQNDSSDTPVISAGQQVTSQLSWANTLTSPLTDAQITIKLSGEALDPSSVTATGGFYRSSDNTVVFARDTNPELASIAPGDTGYGSFGFSTKQASVMKTLRNPAILATMTVTGRTNAGGNAPKQVTSTITRTIQVATDLSLRAYALRTAGAFKNTGPWPPKADAESTYTIVLSFTNTVNSVAGASVQATLPSYVRFTGATSPSDGSITYNESARQVTWAAGEVAAGGSPKQASFQVALLPSTTQRGTSPVLVSQVSYAGTDRFTKRAIQGTAYDISIQTTNDPAYQPSFGEVAR